MKNLDTTYFKRQEKIIYFCVNLGANAGHYLPHMALLAGEDFGKDTQKNNDSGYNWVISQLSDKMSGDYGLTKNGIFFVSKKLIDRYLTKSDQNLIEIKSSATAWQAKKMILQGDYYIFKIKK